MPKLPNVLGPKWHTKNGSQVKKTDCVPDCKEVKKTIILTV